MSYGDAIEGAKSSALARNCKQLGISLELWDAEWVDGWKKQYAHKIPNPTGGRPEHIWVRKDDKRYSVPSPFKTKPVQKPASKSVAKPTPQSIANAMEHIRTGEEVPPTEDSLPVDEQFPKGEIKTEEVAGAFSVTDLRKAENIKAIKAATNADIPTIMTALNNLAKDGKYTIKQVAEMLTAGEKSDG